MSPMDRLLDAVVWQELPAIEPLDDDGDTPHATHEGVLAIGENRLKVYILSSGQRVIDADDLGSFFGVEP